MNNVMVLGGGGYLGIPLCNELGRLGYGVACADRFYFGKYPDKGKNRYTLVADIRAITPETLKGFDAVFDLAGLSNDATAEIDSTLTRDINERGGLNVIEYAQQAGVRRYIYSSSASVYGAATKLGMTEEDIVNPLTSYAKSKSQVEQHALVRKTDTFEPVILRNATAFGLSPRMRFDLAVNVMTMRAWRDGIIYIIGGGSQWRPFCSVGDIIRAFILALEAPAEKVSGQIFNVGTDCLNLTIQQVANVVHEEFPSAKMHLIPDDPDARSYNLSFKKIKDVLGFECHDSIQSAVIDIKNALINGKVDPNDPTCVTLAWYKELMAWEKRLDGLRLNGKIL